MTNNNTLLQTFIVSFATFQGTISSGLIPSAAFVVVPRTPGPDTPPGTDIALASSSGILSASLLAKARGMIPTAADDDPFSDPESSLYDYQVMEEAGSVKKFLTFGKHSQFVTVI